MYAPMIVCPSCRMEYDDAAASRFCGRCGSDMRRSPDGGGATTGGDDDPFIGRVIDARYRVVRKLGQGGMGAVYQVEHLAMGKQAAMKVLHPQLTRDPEIGQRFRREAEAVSRLSSPNTVQVFDFGETAGVMYLVMELIRGEDLGSVVRRDGPLPFARARGILMQVCDALSEAHELGIVHRDLKPENLIVGRTRDGGDLVKVLDFGLAKLRDVEEQNQVTARGSLLGTPYYMSPEQIRGEDLDGRSDLYSLGAVMYRVLTGDPPFSGPTPVAVLTQHLTEKPMVPSRRKPELRIAPEVDALVLRALARDRDQRFASADAFKEALATTLPGASLSASALHRVAQRRASDEVAEAAVDSVAPTVGAGELRREDIDAYARSLSRRRWFGWAAFAAVIVGLGTAGFLALRPTAAVVRDVEEEPNDTAAQANGVASEAVIRGHIGKRLSIEESDRDFFTFHVDGGNVLRVELTGIPTMDLKLEIFDANGQRVVDTDAGGRGAGEVVPNIRLSFGTYYIAVREVWVSGQPADEDMINWYTLTPSWKPLAPDYESEPDDRPDQALPIAVGRPMHGYLGRAADVDFFRPTGTGGGTLSAQLSGIDGVDTRILVLPANTPSTIDVTANAKLPRGTKVFDTGGPGEPEHMSDIPWPAGQPSPLIVVERQEHVGRPPFEVHNQAHNNLVGIDVPYALTVELSRPPQ